MHRKTATIPPKSSDPSPPAGSTPRTAGIVGAILGGAGLIAAWKLNTSFFGIVVAYLALNVLYSTFLKRVFLLDVFIVAAGFLFRVIAGGLVIRVRHFPLVDCVHDAAGAFHCPQQTPP